MGLVELTSAGLLFIGISIITYQLITLSKSIKQADTSSAGSESTLLPIIMPLLAILAPLNANLKLKKYRSSLTVKFRQAGGVKNFTVDLFLSAKELSAIAGIIFYLIMFKTPTSGPPLAAMLTMATMFWFVPNLILSGHIKDREKNIIRELPYILDLLTVSVEAGLDFMQAVERVVKVLKKGVLVQELGIMHKGLQMGDSRKAVLRQLAYRTEVGDVKAVVSALIQADQLGTGIGAVLRTVSSQARIQRSQRAEKMAGEATVKLLFPLMLVFAAVMLIVLGPVALQIMSTMRGH